MHSQLNQDYGDLSGLPRRSWWGRNWKWVVPVGCLLPLLACCGLFTIVFTLGLGALKASPPYAQGLTAAQNDPRLQAALGTPIEASYLPAGQFQFDDAGGSADITLNLTGPRGSATLFIEATRVNDGEWVFHTLMAQPVDGPPIDLLEDAEEATPLP